jgi:sporulation protein YlmC with PRC-barrel domain
MIRKLLATTALVTIAAGGAYAAEGQMSGRFMTSASDASMASKIIGETVYTSSAADAESVGEINDLLVGSDGEIDAAIVGVGGFLGIGEKNVAVSYDDLKLTTDDDGTYHVVLETSKEELESAPAFDVSSVTEAHTNAMAPKGEAKDRMAAANKDAMATDNMAANEPAVNREAVAAGREKYAIVDVTTMGTDDLLGANVYSYDNDNLGEIGEIVLDKDGKTDAVVIDVGGFLGIGEKPVAVAFEDLEFRADENGTIYVYTQFTEEQLESATEYDAEGYMQSRDQMRIKGAS